MLLDKPFPGVGEYTQFIILVGKLLVETALVSDLDEPVAIVHEILGLFFTLECAGTSILLGQRSFQVIFVACE